MILTKEQILSADDLAKASVSVPEWGGDVFVRQLSGQEMVDLLADSENFNRRALLMSVCNEHGEPLFSDADLEALWGKSHKALNRIVEAFAKLNLMDAEEAEKKS